MLKALFVGYPGWVAPTVGLGLALLVAYGIAEVVARLARMLLLRITAQSSAAFRSPLVRRPVRLIRVATFLMVGALLAVPGLELGGWRSNVGPHAENLGAWFLGSGLRILLIALVAWMIVRLVGSAADRLERDVLRSADPGAAERAKRVHTLGTLVNNTVAVVVGGAAALMVLHELKVDIMPLLTGAGILGLAVGFGAQTLVKDVISGFFLILEDQIRVGDVAVINGTGGLVEAVNLRTIVLRDVEGTVHVVPNGSITSLANRTKDFAYAVLDIGVGYREDTDRVVALLREVAAGLQADAQVGANILEPLEVLGVDAFAESAVTIKVRLKTLPSKQWETAREFRRRIKKAFDASGVEIPFPQRVIYHRGDATPRDA